MLLDPFKRREPSYLELKKMVEDLEKSLAHFEDYIREMHDDLITDSKYYAARLATIKGHLKDRT